MYRLYVTALNRYPLVIPAGIFCAAFAALVPFLGVYAAIIALVLAAQLTAHW